MQSRVCIYFLAPSEDRTHHRFLGHHTHCGRESSSSLSCSCCHLNTHHSQWCHWFLLFSFIFDYYSKDCPCPEVQNWALLRNNKKRRVLKENLHFWETFFKNVPHSALEGLYFSVKFFLQPLDSTEADLVFKGNLPQRHHHIVQVKYHLVVFFQVVFPGHPWSSHISSQTLISVFSKCWCLSQWEPYSPSKRHPSSRGRFPWNTLPGS